MWVPIYMGTDMAAGNQQKHLSLSFDTKARIYLLKNLKKGTITLYSNARTVQIAVIPDISHFLNQHHSSLVSHVNATSRKSLEIKA